MRNGFFGITCGVTFLASVLTLAVCGQTVSAAAELESMQSKNARNVNQAVAMVQYVDSIEDNSAIENALSNLTVFEYADALNMAANEDEAIQAAEDMAAICDDDIAATIESNQPAPAPAASANDGTATVSDTSRAASIAAEMASRPTMIGRWRIPAGNLNVAVVNEWSQASVDLPDTANSMMTGNNNYIFTDHNMVGSFRGLESCSVGTLAYFDTASGTTTYRCTGVTYGVNCGYTASGYQVVDSNGNSIMGVNPNGITCCTCADDTGINVLIVYFQPVG